MGRSISFTIEGDVTTQVTVTELSDGTLKFDITVVDDSAQIGDLRAIFFDLEGVDSTTLDLAVVDDNADGSQIISDQVFEEGGVSTIGKDANIKGEVSNELGDFDVGVEFGTSGVSGDDIQSTSFILSSATQDMSLDMLNLADFGIRYGSVGETDGDRTGSLKLGDQGTGVNQNDTLGVIENSSPNQATGDNIVDIFANDQTTDSTDENIGLFVTGVEGLLEAGGVFTGTLISDDGIDLGTLEVDASGIARFEARADALAKDETREIVVKYQTTAADGSTATAFLTVTVTG
ncbi:hypothetical protein ACOI1H_25160, partial [Loktanella sp. DJP18]|uniref:hypothetical protein n=1 Tax=Loktanella sp. DJP18 TaxID=3409788 RepID=UPI003BB564ED